LDVINEEFFDNSEQVKPAEEIKEEEAAL